jgi:hypothetical protein
MRADSLVEAIKWECLLKKRMGICDALFVYVAMTFCLDNDFLLDDLCFYCMIVRTIGYAM